MTPVKTIMSKIKKPTKDPPVKWKEGDTCIWWDDFITKKTKLFWFPDEKTEQDLANFDYNFNGNPKKPNKRTKVFNDKMKERINNIKKKDKKKKKRKKKKYNNKIKFTAIKSKKINNVKFKDYNPDVRTDTMVKDDYKIKFDNLKKKYDDKKIVKEKYDRDFKELSTKQNKELDKVGKNLKSKRVFINFNKKQKTTIKKWVKVCDNVYNATIRNNNKIYKKRKILEDKGVNKKDLPYFNTDYKITKIIIFDELFGEDKKPAPYDMLTDDVKVACANVKSCLTNLKNGNITHFEIKERISYKSRSICIPIGAINKNGIFVRELGNVDMTNVNIGEICGDARLIYDFVKDCAYLSYPYMANQSPKIKKKPVVALDPGEKIFMTFYSPTECGKIGDDIRKPILREQNKIRKLDNLIKKGKNRYDEKISHQGLKKLKKRRQDKFTHISNMVKDLHNKTALFLCKNYETILLPRFETRKMVLTKNELINLCKEKREKIKDENKDKTDQKLKLKEYCKRSKLNKRVKFVLIMLSHYKFREHLLEKSKDYGSQVIIVDEEYTSKCCGKCGKLSDKFTKRIKKCTECEAMIDRDYNGARNILMKHLKTIVKA